MVGKDREWNFDNRMNVLVVDDDYVSHFISERLLSRLGFIDRIYAAFNGLEALAILEKMCHAVQALPGFDFTGFAYAGDEWAGVYQGLSEAGLFAREGSSDCGVVEFGESGGA